MSTDPRDTTVESPPPLTRTALLRRARRRAVERPITEGHSDHQIRFREAIFRRSLAVADVLAAALALIVCVNILGDDRLHLIALLALPLIVIAGKAHRITPVERCLFVGVDESFERLQSKLPKGNRHAQLVGRMSLDPMPSDRLLEAGPRTLHQMIENLDVHRVIIEPSEALPEATLDFVREAKSTGVRVSLLPRILEVVGSRPTRDRRDLQRQGQRASSAARGDDLVAQRQPPAQLHVSQ